MAAAVWLLQAYLLDVYQIIKIRYNIMKVEQSQLEGR